MRMSRKTKQARGTGVRVPTCLALVAAAALAAAGAARAQVAAGQPSGQPCPGSVVGTLGIIDMDCRGCALRLRVPEHGSPLWTPEWSFSAEPQVARIAPNSPAVGVLQVRDRIVAVDGFLITTEEGGRRFARLRPDSVVTIRYRRDGRTHEVELRAIARCGPAVEGSPVPLVPAQPADALSGVAVTWGGPGFLIQTWTGPDGRRTVMTMPSGWQVGTRSDGRAAIEIPEARYGMNFACGPCSSRDAGGRRVWRFSNPIEVISVQEGGPAEQAGLQAGDRITHVDGARIESQAGGEAFSSVRRGRPVRLTVTGRDGRERTVTLVPGGLN